MTKQEIITALKLGATVRHRYFSDEEYIKANEFGELIDERGNIMGAEFWELRQQPSWETDWSIVEPKA